MDVHFDYTISFDSKDLKSGVYVKKTYIFLLIDHHALFYIYEYAKFNNLNPFFLCGMLHLLSLFHLRHELLILFNVHFKSACIEPSFVCCHKLTGQ